MHETALIRDLLNRAEAVVGGDGSAITRLRLRIGALSGVTPGHLRDTAQREARERWGHEPAVDIEQSDDPSDLAALGVVLVSVER
jgi:Zn finger protein HypA/HybF involved in hydrogenase expression